MLAKRNKIINNVPDIKDDIGNWITSYTVTDEKYYTQHRTTAFNLWLGINNRCKHDGYQQFRSPNYVGTENQFNSFQEFAEWCQHQYGYNMVDEKGNRWQLDKDLFGKHYNPKTCVFLPASLNTLLKSHPEKDNELPIGVAIDNSNNRKQIYSVRYFKYKQGYVGRARFYSAEEAGAAWRANRQQSFIEASCDPNLSEKVRLRLHELSLNL